MTNEQLKRYLEIGGVCCLFCGHNDLDPGNYETGHDCVNQHVTCCKCGANWTDHYTLTGVTPDEE